MRPSNQPTYSNIQTETSRELLMVLRSTMTAPNDRGDSFKERCNANAALRSHSALQFLLFIGIHILLLFALEFRRQEHRQSFPTRLWSTDLDRFHSVLETGNTVER